MLTRHCHSCGLEYQLARQPGRTETCDCGADLKVCLNCAHYDARVADQCRERRADPVLEKHMANFCEYFEYAHREWTEKKEDPRMQAARDNLKKLF